MAQVAAAGGRVTLVCTTRGDVGEISDPALATPETLPEVREGELRRAAETLGIDAPIFLDFRDSGMAGTPDNDHPKAFVNAVDDEVVERLVEIIRDVRPSVVLTFDETGGYGHPDHIAIWKYAHAAVEAASDAAKFQSTGEAWQVERIAYAVFPISFFRHMREKLVELGADTSELDAFFERGAGFPDERVHAIVDVSDVVERKIAALDCHETQFGGDNFFARVGPDEMRRMMSREYFSFGWPVGVNGQVATTIFP